MSRFPYIAVSIAGLFLYSCASKTLAPKPPVVSLQTDHSFGNADQIRTTHMHLDLKVDFSKKNLSGTVTHQLERSGKDSVVVFDTKGLAIEAVWLDGGEKTDYQLGAPDSLFGTPLLISLKPGTRSVTVQYHTDSSAEALQWLNPMQTHDRRHPFLFTQSQAILARTWIPLMDRPDVRSTYSARISCPKSLMALMSASNPQQRNDSGVYHFQMPQPVSSYLMALAVGDLSFKALDSQSGVYAEPKYLDSVAWELADMPAMIQKASALYGAYPWGRYDVLVLPPSFPFGGMENPRLTFATPTIIAGDRSLTSLVAHELAHSWSGNLVTNATWNDFWLNEGFTVYFENRIVEAVYGKDFADMCAELEVGELERTVQRMMREAPDDTKLALNLKGRNPDDGLTDIAYIKGFLFLKHMERLVGRARWDAFLKDYFQSFSFETIHTEAFKSYLHDHLFANAEEAVKAKLNDWLYGQGLPEDAPKPSSVKLKTAAEAAAKYSATRKADPMMVQGWVTQQYQHFLRNMPKDISAQELESLDQAIGFSKSGNAEVLCDWFTLSVKAWYRPAFIPMESFLVRVGRRKFLKPVYEALSATPQGLELGRSIFKRAKTGYHSVSAASIAEILRVQP
jgi:leukotriene-A4 hydrolase